MLPTEELFGHVYVLVHDLILAGAIEIPRRPAPACADAELLAIWNWPPRRPHLLGTARQDRRHRRRPHPAPGLPHPRLTEPT
jgi:hypothetical protein